jgi:hypothetical protein
MTPLEELHNAVWQILCEIKQEQLATPNDQWIIIDTGASDRERAVRLIAKAGGIKALEYQPSLAATLQTIRQLNGVYSKPTAYKVEAMSPRFEEVYELYESIFNHEYNADEIKYLTNQVQLLSPSSKQPSEKKVTNLSAADQKKLLLLEKLKEEWDLTPKQNSDPVMVRTGIGTHLVKAGLATISNQKFHSWMNQCGISDWYEFESILNILKQEGLISKFENLNEAA